MKKFISHQHAALKTRTTNAVCQINVLSAIRNFPIEVYNLLAEIRTRILTGRRVNVEDSNKVPLQPAVTIDLRGYSCLFLFYKKSRGRSQ